MTIFSAVMIIISAVITIFSAVMTLFTAVVTSQPYPNLIRNNGKAVLSDGRLGSKELGSVVPGLELVLV
jgi:hypothetical protein